MRMRVCDGLFLYIVGCVQVTAGPQQQFDELDVIAAACCMERRPARLVPDIGVYASVESLPRGLQVATEAEVP